MNTTRARSIRLVLAVAAGVCLVPGVAMAALGDTTMVSVSSAGAQSNGLSRNPAISSDGGITAFASNGTNLVAGDTNGLQDIFVRDSFTDVTERVNVSSGSAQAVGGDSYSPALSGDGRYVVFVSEANNLVAGDTNGAADVFRRDRVTGTTVLVSANLTGTGPANGVSAWPSVSANGRYVAFESAASDIGVSDTNGVTDVFLRDVDGGFTVRVSVVPGLGQGDAASYDANISADGNYIAFTSEASNLVIGDTNGVSDVLVASSSSGAISRVSLGASGVQGNGSSLAPDLSDDGRYVAFRSDAANLVSGDTNGFTDIFVRDRVAGVTTRVSVGPGGAQANADSSYPSISGDGGLVAFDSMASNLVAGDTNGVSDIFMRDRAATATDRLSVGSSGVQADGLCWLPEISAIGARVVYRSEATNLVSGDLNATDDMFLFERYKLSTSVTIRTTATSARTGSVPTLSGAVTPVEMIGRNMVAYVKKPGRAYYSYSSNRTVYASGGGAAWLYKYTFKPGMTKGTYVFKAVVPAWFGFHGSTSPTSVSIRLR